MSDADGNDTSVTANQNTAALPTVFTTAADMFKIADPVPVEKLTSGTCEFPRALRGADSKTRSKIKERCCKAIKNKFDVPFYYRSSKYTSHTKMTERSNRLTMPSFPWSIAVTSWSWGSSLMTCRTHASCQFSLMRTEQLQYSDGILWRGGIYWIIMGP